MPVGLAHYLTVAAILFTTGIFGIFLNRKNVIIIMMSIELMLLAVNINFVAFSVALNDLVGQVFAMFVLTVAAAASSADTVLIQPAQPRCCPVCGGTRLVYRELAPVPATSDARPADSS